MNKAGPQWAFTQEEESGLHFIVKFLHELYKIEKIISLARALRDSYGTRLALDLDPLDPRTPGCSPLGGRRVEPSPERP